MSSKEERRSATSWESMLAGGLSGGVTRFLCQPFDVLKIRFQVSVKFVTHPTVSAAALFPGTNRATKPFKSGVKVQIHCPGLSGDLPRGEFTRFLEGPQPSPDPLHRLRSHPVHCLRVPQREGQGARDTPKTQAAKEFPLWRCCRSCGFCGGHPTGRDQDSNNCAGQAQGLQELPAGHQVDIPRGRSTRLLQRIRPLPVADNPTGGLELPLLQLLLQPIAVAAKARETRVSFLIFRMIDH